MEGQSKRATLTDGLAAQKNRPDKVLSFLREIYE